MTIRLLALVLLIPGILCGQFADDFSDGNITSAPRWTGDTLVFRITSGQLQLNAPPMAGMSFLSLPSAAVYKAAWEWWFEFGFNPSSSNLSRVYLTSDNPDLTGPLNGYFVMAGNTGDEISLYRQSGTTIEKLIDGLDGRLNYATVRARVKVETDEDGTWTLSVDTGPEGPTGTYVIEGSAQDSRRFVSGWFGIRCQYTSTRSDKFRFDDFVVTGTTFPDRTPPLIDSVEVTDERTVVIRFNEPVDAKATQPEFYRFINSVSVTGSVATAQDGRYRLTVDPPLVNGITNRLLVSGISDLAGNKIRDTTLTIMHLISYNAAARDVVITEIMADPSPQEGLPAAEYLELFNRSAHAIGLGGWTITDGSAIGKLPPAVILPGEYRLLVSGSLPQTIYPEAIRIATMPSLNNDGDHLALTSSGGLLIDSVGYSVRWHRVPGKQEGGWSLEMIDPENRCGPEGNWTSSEASDGGTPGARNSVYAVKPDLTPPSIQSTEVVGTSRLLVTFDEKLKKEILTPSMITLKPESGNAAISIVNDRRVALEFEQPFGEGIFYRVFFKGVRDCPGNESQELTARFILPSRVDSLDAIINEVLFNPLPGGVDYVEVYNRSDKFLSTSGWTLGNFEDSISVNRKPLPPHLIWPRSYAVITSDPDALKFSYPAVPDSLLVIMTMPSLPDDEGSVALDGQDVKLDGFHYDRDMHGWLIRNEEGIPLERLDPEGPTEDRDNWRSAARGIGTPGAPNSCLVQALTDEEGLTVDPEAFGMYGFTRIGYRLSEPGYMATVRVYDRSGFLVKTLVNNENLGAEGFFRWDGDRDGGGPAGPGFFIVLAEVFNDRGHVMRYRRRVVIAVE